VLAERPGDPVALRMRDELVKKATIVGLASLPRTPPGETNPWVRRAKSLLIACLAAAIVGLVAALIRQLFGTNP
jgi:hypothetical protein